MDARELQSEIAASSQLVIVDLREPELYRAGHVPGAENIPFEQFKDRMNELSPESSIVLVCHTGPMGEVSGTLLAERGYASVRNLRGGMAAWNGELAR
ncbi:MAG: rhodanese-like domain-containing protein [Chloroflexi bacterium]|nr:rhodanese-like domain-containing protein [Chloroflexota bacterium]